MDGPAAPALLREVAHRLLELQQMSAQMDAAHRALLLHEGSAKRDLWKVCGCSVGVELMFSLQRKVETVAEELRVLQLAHERYVRSRRHVEAEHSRAELLRGRPTVR